MGVRQQTVDHLGGRLAYDVRGGGPPVLFIQGVGVHGAGWLPQIDELAGSFECVSFDNRGMGRSQPASNKLTVEQMADDARAVMDATGWPSAHVVGHSLGGLVAVTLALAAPGRVRSLSLLCTFASGRSAAPLTARLIWGGLRTKVGTRGMRRRGFLRLVLPPPALAKKEADAMAEKLAPLFGHDLADSPPVVSAQLKAMRAADTTTRLRELAHVPALVMTGAHDPIAPPGAGRELANGIPGARYVEHADASHGLPIQWAARVNGQLAEHLSAAEQAWAGKVS